MGNANNVQQTKAGTAVNVYAEVGMIEWMDIVSNAQIIPSTMEWIVFVILGISVEGSVAINVMILALNALEVKLINARHVLMSVTN